MKWKRSKRLWLVGPCRTDVYCKVKTTTLRLIYCSYPKSRECHVEFKNYGAVPNTPSVLMKVDNICGLGVSLCLVITTQKKQFTTCRPRYPYLIGLKALPVGSSTLLFWVIAVCLHSEWTKMVSLVLESQPSAATFQHLSLLLGKLKKFLPVPKLHL